MKKLFMFCLFLCLIILSGCQTNVGSLQEGTLDLAKYGDIMNQQIEGQNWKMGLLRDGIEKREVEKMYHLDMTKVEDSYVMCSIVESQLSEIALFKVSKENEQVVKDSIAYRLHSFDKAWGNYTQDAQKKLSNYKQGRIGKYYYFVLGEDYKKVVNYIRNSE